MNHDEHKRSGRGDSAPDAGGLRGRLETVALGLLTQTARVGDVQVLGSHYRRIRLQGEPLRGVEWTPGDTVRLVLPGWHKRCYTPVSWDTRLGEVDFVAYVHGQGPGSDWAATLRAGDECSIRGPRGAIDLRTAAAPSILFGDETSLTSAAALRALDRQARVVLEVGSIKQARMALAALGIDDAQLFERHADDRQLGVIEPLLIEHLQAQQQAGAVLTGCATSIQRLYKSLRRAGIAARRVKNHAYWSPGKKGLE